ncbi:uncharacterized protein LOC143036861 [Oratosquilla oratoria]|uniref:uncharacterized protein LOC143036861 n=1 Tax=Oratosquilla oratoria TaxID=337810 RepID=UPI003F765979
MEPSKPIETGSAFGIPKWMRRKSERYEVEDFIVSPPSSEEGFFQLRYGHSHGRRQSTYDRIESEIPLEVQGSDVSAVPLEGESFLLGSFSKFELSWEKPNQTSSDSTSDNTVKPLIVLPLRLSQPSGPTEKIQREEKPSSDMRLDDNTPTAQVLSSIPSTPLTPITPETESRLKGEVGRNPIITLSPSIQKCNDYQKSLLEKVSHIPFTTPLGTPLPTPGCTPQNSPVFKRKISASCMPSSVIMEEDNERGAASKSHYFFTGSSVTGISSNTTPPPAADSTMNTASNFQMTALQTQQMEAAAKAAASLDPRAMGTKRKARPKASALREMNFWAPTSM